MMMVTENSKVARIRIGDPHKILCKRRTKLKQYGTEDTIDVGLELDMPLPPINLWMMYAIIYFYNNNN